MGDLNDTFVFPTLYAIPGENEECIPGLGRNYDPWTGGLLCLYSAFGVLAAFLGYRVFKALMFLTGFVFGSLIVYLVIATEEGSEEFLPKWSIISIGVGAGFLLGLITLLIQYVGLFILGFHAGILGGLALLAALQYTSLYIPASPWICVVILLFCAIIMSFSNLYFQKTLTIGGSAFYGAAIIAAVLDYFIENSTMLLWIWDKVKVVKSPEPCWYSWILLSAWPVIFVTGVITQILITGKGTHHERPFQYKSRSSPESREERKQRKYRYLYQVRTCHGDVISQPIAKKYVHQVNDESFA